jgi:hypothetical protein
MLTRQEVFDKVVTHLRKQGRKAELDLSYEDGAMSCAYRGEEGTMCAAGCLIDDERYDRDLEGSDVTSAKVTGALLSSGLSPHDITFVRELQKVHDGLSTEAWERSWAALAADNNLTMPPAP